MNTDSKLFSQLYGMRTSEEWQVFRTWMVEELRDAARGRTDDLYGVSRILESMDIVDQYKPTEEGTDA